MVVFDAANPKTIRWLMRDDFQNQAPLVVKPNRPLVGTLAFKFLEMKRLESIEIAFVIRRPKLLHSPPEGFDYVPAEPGREFRIGLQSVESLVREFHIHGDPHVAQPALS
jgi:hypothetical protein